MIYNRHIDKNATTSLIGRVPGLPEALLHRVPIHADPNDDSHPRQYFYTHRCLPLINLP